MASKPSPHSKQSENTSMSGSQPSEHQKFISSKNEQKQLFAVWVVLAILIIGTITLVAWTFATGNSSLQASAIQFADIALPAIVGFTITIWLKKPPIAN